MQEITLWQDWLLLCSAPETTAVWSWSVIGLMIDVVGFLLLARTTYVAIRAKEQTIPLTPGLSPPIDSDFEAQKEILRRIMLEETYDRAIKFVEITALEIMGFREFVSIGDNSVTMKEHTGPLIWDKYNLFEMIDATLTFGNTELEDKITTFLESRIRNEFPGFEKPLNEIIRLRALKLGDDAQEIQLKRRIAKLETNRLFAATFLIVFGFLLQIIGALPCPIDQLPTL